MTATLYIINAITTETSRSLVDMTRKYNEFSIRIPPGIDKIVERKCEEYGWKKNDFFKFATNEFLLFLKFFPKVEEEDDCGD